MDRRWKKTSIVNDVPKRKAMHRFAKKAADVKDGRLGLMLMLAWDEGYEAARRRFKR